MHSIESLTTATVSMALDAASLRQQVIAANIANAGRPDFEAQRVSFEATLSGLQHPSSAGSSAPASPAFALRAQLSPDLGSDGVPHAVALDSEVGALAQNTLHYQALVRGLSKYMSVMASAVSEGKR